MKKNRAQPERAATFRAARGTARVAVPTEQGQGRGLGRSRFPCPRGCGGRAAFGRTGRLQAPPARAQRMTASYPAAAAFPARRGTEGSPPPPADPGQPRAPVPRPRCTAPARPASAAGGAATARSLARTHAGADTMRQLPASPGVLTAPPASPPQPGTAPSPRCQPNLRRCSAPPELPQAPVSTCARPRSAARAGSASPLLAAPGLIFCSSLAAVVGLLPPRQLLFCTALSPFPAISNLHALSFLRYRLILVWRRRFAILSHAHSCG